MNHSNNKNIFITAFSENHKFNSDLYNLEFPATILVYGEPKSGKTYFVLNLLNTYNPTHFGGADPPRGGWW